MPLSPALLVMSLAVEMMPAPSRHGWLTCWCWHKLCLPGVMGTWQRGHLRTGIAGGGEKRFWQLVQQRTSILETVPCLGGYL